MQKVTNKLRVSHYPQLPCKPFIVEVADEFEASKISNVLANQHLFLFENKIKIIFFLLKISELKNEIEILKK